MTRTPIPYRGYTLEVEYSDFVSEWVCYIRNPQGELRWPHWRKTKEEAEQVGRNLVDGFIRLT